MKHVKRISAILVCIFFMSFTVAAFLLKAADSRSDLEKSFLNTAEHSIEDFRDILNHNLHDTLSVGAFFESTKDLSWDEFERFIDPIIRDNKGLKAIVWIPKVPASKRNSVEAKMRSYGIEDFSIMRHTPNHAYVREVSRDVYYPVYYFKRLLFQKEFLGLNLGAYSEKTQLFEQVIREGRPVISTVLSIDNQPIEPGTHCLYVPVYRPQQITCTPKGRQENLVGFVGGYIDFNQLLRDTKVSSSHGIHLAYSDKQIISRQAVKFEETEPQTWIFAMPKQLEHHFTLPIDDQYISLEATPTEGYLANNYSRSHWIILTLGIAGSLLLGLYLNGILNREEKAEEMVRRRTQQLSEEKEKASAMAMKARVANKAKSSFLSKMSHEMRTPLNSIIGFTELLTQEELNDEQKDYLETVLQSARHLLELINDILDLARIESGKIEVCTSEVVINEMLTKVCKMVQPQAREKQLSIKLDLDETLPNKVFVNGRHLEQSLINLVGNAVKFTPEGTIWIRACLVDNDQGLQLQLEVEDTGIGIPPRKISHVFDSFSQVDNSESRKYQGTGLGLTITKNFVELMGGYITVQSKLGQGSVFAIVVPVQLDELVEKQEDSGNGDGSILYVHGQRLY